MVQHPWTAVPAVPAALRPQSLLKLAVSYRLFLTVGKRSLSDTYMLSDAFHDVFCAVYIK